MPSISQSSQLIWMEFVLRLLVNWISHLFHRSGWGERRGPIFKGENPNLVNSSNNFGVALDDLETLFFSNLAWRERLLNSILWYQFWWPCPSFKVTMEKSVHSFSPKYLNQLLWNLLCCHNCWFVEAYAKFSLHDLRERTLIMWYEICLWHMPASGHLQIDLLRTWYDVDTT